MSVGPDDEGMLTRALPGLALLRSYRRAWLRRDLPAGVTLWAMLVPQSLGFSVLAGLPPVVGLYAALGAMLLYWMWGSSPCLNVGAESTVAIMVATIMVDRADAGSEDYVELTALLAILVGLVLVVGGVLRLGRVADFLSRPVLAGYVFGSGVLIITSQLQGLLGTSIDPDPYLTEVGAILRNLDEIDIASVLFGAASIVVIVVMRRFTPAIPGALVAVVGSMVIVAAFDLDVPVVGEFTSGLPAPGVPDVGWAAVADLIGPAFAVALLVYPDSVLTARSLAQSTGDRIDANREFYAIGAANVGAGLIGGFPVNGSQSRSFVLADAGARTQVASLGAAALVVATLLVLAPVFDHLPTATLAGIVIVAGFGLFDIAEFGALWRFRRTEFGLALLTIGGVLALGMLIGIVIAIGLSLLVVVLRAANPHTAVLGRVPGTDTYRDVTDHVGATTYPGLLIYRFDASVFFANAPKLRDEILVHVDGRETVTVVIDMESVDDVDATGVQMIGELLDEIDKRGVGLELSRVRTEIRDELRIAGIEQRLSGVGIHLEVHDAVVAFLASSASDGGSPDASSR